MNRLRLTEIVHLRSEARRHWSAAHLFLSRARRATDEKRRAYLIGEALEARARARFASHLRRTIERREIREHTATEGAAQCVS